MLGCYNTTRSFQEGKKGVTIHGLSEKKRKGGYFCGRSEKEFRAVAAGGGGGWGGE